MQNKKKTVFIYLGLIIALMLGVYMMSSMIRPTGGETYQNLYAYAANMSIKSSTSLLLNGFAQFQIYTDTIQKYPNMQITKIMGLL